MLGRTGKVHPPGRHRLVDAMNAAGTPLAQSPRSKHSLEEAIQDTKDAMKSSVAGTTLSSVKSPPPVLPPPPPSLSVVCVPIAMDLVSGCGLRVLSAQPDSTLLIRIVAKPGGEMNLTLHVPAGQSTAHAMVETGLANDGLPKIEGTAEYAGSPSSRVAVGTADPALTITEAACRCSRFVFFWDRCLLYSNYTTLLPESQPARLVAHSTLAGNDDEDLEYAFQVRVRMRGLPRLSMPFTRRDVGHISVTLAVPDMGIYASRPCID